MRDVGRKRMLALAMAIAMDDEEDDQMILSVLRKKKRQHDFWMHPFLYSRTDSSERNTLAKLEADFIRVNINLYVKTQYLYSTYPVNIDLKNY